MSSLSHIRRNSPISTLGASHGYLSQSGMGKHIDVGSDSDSDDEPPPEIRFSKVTQALLADAGERRASPQNEVHINSYGARALAKADTPDTDTPSRAPGLRIIRRSSPQGPSQNDRSRRTTPPRVISISTRHADPLAQRPISVGAPHTYDQVSKRDPTPEIGARPEMKTPAPGIRASYQARSRSDSNASQDAQTIEPSSARNSGSRTGLRSASDSSERKVYASELGRSASLQHPPETISKYGSTTLARSRNAAAEAGAHASQGIKRIPDGESRFLRSKPVRRGFRRRDSEENVSPVDDPQSGQSSQPHSESYTPQERAAYRDLAPRSRSDSVDRRGASVEPVSVHDFASQSNHHALDSRPGSRQAVSYVARSQVSSEARPDSQQANRELVGGRRTSSDRSHARATSVTHSQPDSGVAMKLDHQRYESAEPESQQSVVDQKPLSRVSSFNRQAHRYASTRHAESADDQENLPPPTFKRNKDQEFRYLGKPSMMAFSDDEKPKHRLVDETPVPVAAHEQRKPLNTISGNTPHRTAPAPPPKMTVLDAATITAGASTTKSRKKRQHMVVNGKIYTQMGKLGKGGSSEVYCVMAENYKTFALKRVKLTNCDESAVRGYKGEIDLLKKLTEVERVVRLFDWELNEEKQELFLLMDKGELDLSRILTLQLNSGEAAFESAFTRFYWREMLECVQAVHDHDIVHSDLKPANFLMVQGRLKLIDFGIANAIDTDHTVNVHRDSHVGTPNYMSPESINDTNASGGGKDEHGRPLKKDMRLGKPSDVWSLGCILYQMAYGIPPFAHMKNQVSKIMAIVNPKHKIDYPETGVGGAYIPLSLRATLRGCLNRDPERRPTIKQMLDGTDAFLNPERAEPGSVLMNEALLGQIINKIIERCSDPKRGLPTPEEAQAYPRSFMERVRMIQEGA